MLPVDDVAIIILAAGKVSRMKSDLAKVLHPVAGKSMVVHVAGCASSVARDHIHVVVGHQAERVKTEVLKFYPTCFALQEELLGTGDAVKAALPGLAPNIQTVLVLCGDVPLIREKTIKELISEHERADAKLSVLAVRVDDPTGYGRIVLDDQGVLSAIREEADASTLEKTIALVNSGIYCFDRKFLETGIDLIRNDNNQAEYYLTDLVEIAVSKNVKTFVQTMDAPGEVMGVNTLEQLAQAEVLFRETSKELP